MSRLSTLSAAAIRAMFSSETDENLIMLLTIYDPDAPSTPIFRLADGYVGRLENLTTDDEVVYGVASRGNDYVFLPMQVELPGEQDTGVGQCRISLQYVTREAIELVRVQLTQPTRVKIELVLSSTPDAVEASFPDFYITSATYNSDTVSFDLTMINLAREPFPCYNFIPTYFPGLF